MKPNDITPPADPPEANNAASAGCMARLVLPSFPGAPETNEYIRDNYNVRLFDAVSCFDKMADIERRMNLAVENMRAADNARMNAEESLHRAVSHKNDFSFRPMFGPE